MVFRAPEREIRLTMASTGASAILQPVFEHPVVRMKMCSTEGASEVEKKLKKVHIWNPSSSIEV